MMGCWLKKSRENIVDDVIVTYVELKISMNFEDCAKKIRKVACQFEGVKSCITDADNEKVMVSGEFNLQKLLKTLKKKTGKKIEILMKTEKSDVVHKEDDEPHTVQNEVNKDEIVQQNDDKPDTVQSEDNNTVQSEDNKDEVVPPNDDKPDTVQSEDNNDDKPETSVMEVEFNIPFLCDKYEKDFGKVISKCEGVERYVADVENKKVMVIGNFDKDKLLRKLNKKMHHKMQKAEKERKERETEMLLKEAEENKRVAEICEEIDKDRNIYLTPKTDYEKEMAKYYMHSDENPNACSIS